MLPERCESSLLTAVSNRSLIRSQLFCCQDIQLLGIELAAHATVHDDLRAGLEHVLHKNAVVGTGVFAALENVNSPKVVVNKNMNALYFSRSIIPYQRNAEKQDWLAGHTYYKHIGLYAYRADALKEITSLPQSSLEVAESLEQLRWLENGYTIKVGISQVETIGIDTPEDLAKAEEFLKGQEGSKA